MSHHHDQDHRDPGQKAKHASTAHKPAKSQSQLDREKEDKAEQERKLKLQRLLRARIIASQMNTDLEMEEAQMEYEKNL